MIRLVLLLGVVVFFGHDAVGDGGVDPKIEQVESARESARAWLFLAAKENDVAKINRLIEAGGDVDARDDYGVTAMMFGIKHGVDPETLSALIEVGAKVDARDATGESAIMYALKYSEDNDNLVQWVEVLLGAGANVNVRNELGQSPLMIGMSKDVSVEVVDRLLDSGGQVNARDAEGRDVLMYGLMHGADIEIIEYLIEVGSGVDSRDASGVTPLMYAARYSQSTEVVELLLGLGANIQDRVPVEYLPYRKRNVSYGDTVPSFAVVYNTNVDVVRLILERWGDVNEVVFIRAANEKTNRPLTMAVSLLALAARLNPSPEILELLLNAGADAKFRNAYGSIALDYAKKNPGLVGTDAFWQLNDASY